VRAFLDMIERTRETRTGEILSEAEKEASAIVHQARSEARARGQRAASENRARSETAVSTARAELGTLFRKTSQEAHRLALSEGQKELEQTLHARWQEPASRKAWTLGLVADALAILPRTAFRIEHPPDLAAAELTDVVRSIERHSGVAPTLLPASDIEVGLRISAGSAVLDGTLPGLLARRAEVEGKLLAEVDAGVGRSR
jgi:hypothetical protein